jgi:hypothetical protein
MQGGGAAGPTPEMRGVGPALGPASEMRGVGRAAGPVLETRGIRRAIGPASAVRGVGRAGGLPGWQNRVERNERRRGGSTRRGSLGGVQPRRIPWIVRAAGPPPEAGRGTRRAADPGASTRWAGQGEGKGPGPPPGAGGSEGRFGSTPRRPRLTARQCAARGAGRLAARREAGTPARVERPRRVGRRSGCRGTTARVREGRPRHVAGLGVSPRVEVWGRGNGRRKGGGLGVRPDPPPLPGEEERGSREARSGRLGTARLSGRPGRTRRGGRRRVRGRTRTVADGCGSRCRRDRVLVGLVAMTAQGSRCGSTRR